MFFLPLSLLTVIMVVLFVANVTQDLVRHFFSSGTNELALVAVSTSIGYVIVDRFSRQFDEGYGHFEKATVSVFGPQYWIVFFVVALGLGATVYAFNQA